MVPQTVESVWCTASYAATKVAHCYCFHVQHPHGEFRNYFAKADVDWSFLHPSQTSHVDPDLGPMRYWDVSIDGDGETRVIKDGAWEYMQPPEDWRDVVGEKITFLIARESTCFKDLMLFKNKTEGLDIVEDWAL